MDALHDDFVLHGVAAIEKVRVEDPAAYLRVICAVLPKELDVALNMEFSAAEDFITAFRLARRQVADLDDPLLLELQVESDAAE